MTSVNYDDIFSSFLGNVTDYELASLNIDDANMLMSEYLHKAVAHSYVKHLFSSSQLDDKVQVFVYTMNHPGDEDGDKEFVITALGKWMTYEWLAKEAKSKIVTSQVFAGKESKFYSQSTHLTSLIALRDAALKEARDFIRDRGFITNSYLEG